jgi:ubiquinone/menaquinone biosynthesis C-methylase UbiE
MKNQKGESFMSHSKLPGSGKSSFDLVDHELVFRELGLTKSKVFLDLGCGSGDYVIAAAEIIGPEGIAYGIDGWSEGIDLLRKHAQEKRFTNVQAFVTSVAKHLPLHDQTVDICLMAVALHDFIRHEGGEVALRETARVLKPTGVLGIVEFKKIDGPPGPPIHIRISPEETENLIADFGFQQTKTLDVGPYTYLTIASISKKLSK